MNKRLKIIGKKENVKLNAIFSIIFQEEVLPSKSSSKV